MILRLISNGGVRCVRTNAEFEKIVNVPFIADSITKGEVHKWALGTAACA